MSSGPSMHSLKSKISFSSSSFPASIFEKSRMSLMTVKRLSPLLRMISMNSRCSVLSGVSSRSEVIPITPFIGVRISWLMVARNWLFARLASTASLVAIFASLTAFSSCSLSVSASCLACCNSVLSVNTPNHTRALSAPSR